MRSPALIAVGAVFIAGFICAMLAISPAVLKAAPASATVIGFMIVLVAFLVIVAAGGIMAWRWFEQSNEQAKYERAMRQAHVLALMQGKRLASTRGQSSASTSQGTGNTIIMPGIIPNIPSPQQFNDDDRPDPLVIFGKWGA